MSELTARLKRLEDDLTAEPMRHYDHADLPFAVFCYHPEEEWTFRYEARLSQTRLEQKGLVVHRISLARLLWRAVEESEGLDELVALEARRGFAAAQAQAQEYLTDPMWRPLPTLLIEALDKAPGKPGRHVAFILRAGALAPAFYRVSVLLDQLKGHTQVPSVLFMPAATDAGGLRFMGVAENEGRGSYHTKVYL